MVALWVWWLAAGLAFLGTLLLAAGAAHGQPAYRDDVVNHFVNDSLGDPAMCTEDHNHPPRRNRLFDLLGTAILAWGIVVALVSGVVELVAWWLT